MAGLPILQVLSPFIFAGYIYGVGNLIGRILFKRRDFTLSVFLSLAFWSVVGWFSPWGIKWYVYIFSTFGIVGLIAGLRDLWEERPLIITFVFIVLLRYLMVKPLTFPYGNDSIMHTCATMSIVYNGYITDTFEPFGLKGLGSFNLGFHLIASGISYIFNLKPMDAVILTAYIFWGTYFLAVNSWVKNPFYAFVITFITFGPAFYMGWGGFPSLAAVSFGLYAFSFKGYASIPLWMGAFSTHFIPSSAAFISYIIAKRKHVVNLKFLLGIVILAVVLYQQYFRILNFASFLDDYEGAILNLFVIKTFWKHAVFMCVYIFLSIVGYRYNGGIREEVPWYATVIPPLLGLLSLVWSLYNLEPFQMRSFYLARMYIPIIIPAILGIKWVFSRFKFLAYLSFIMGSAVVVVHHTFYAKDPKVWKYIKSCCKNEKWIYTTYGSEESFLPIMGIPVYESHYLITQMSEARNLARTKDFSVVFLREKDSNTKVREIVSKYGILIKDFGYLKVYKLRRFVKGYEIIP